MPAQTGKTKVLAKVAAELAPALAQGMQEPVKYGMLGPPPGIKGGIAQLVECGFSIAGADKKYPGKPMFQAVAVIVAPKSVIYNGAEVLCEGLHTRLFRYICDTTGKTPKSTRENALWVQNELRKLGGDGFDASDLEVAAATLEKTKPYFRFSTDKSEAQDRIDPKTKKVIKGEEGVWENWNGIKGLEGYKAPVNGQAVQDSSAQVQEEAPAGGQPDGQTIDLIALTEAAMADPEGAEALALGKYAIETVGLDHEAVTNAESWQVVYDMIQAASSGEGQEEGSEEGGEEGGEETQPEPRLPKKGETWVFLTTHSKTKKPIKPKCEIQSVNLKAKTADIKRLDLKTVVKGVKFDALEEVSA